MQTEIFTPTRLNSLCDGVFAIAMTLLVLDLRLPQPATLPDAVQFVEMLNNLGPSLMSYLISFFVIGIYWQSNNKLSHALASVDKTVINDTFKLLLGISLLPLSTQIQGRYGYLGHATSFYALNVALCGLASFKVWRYCSQNPHLLAPHVTEEHLMQMKYTLVLTPAVFLLSIPVSFYNTSYARYTWIICFFHRPISKYLRSLLSPAKNS